MLLHLFKKKISDYKNSLVLFFIFFVDILRKKVIRSLVHLSLVTYLSVSEMDDLSPINIIRIIDWPFSDVNNTSQTTRIFFKINQPLQLKNSELKFSLIWAYNFMMYSCFMFYRLHNVYCLKLEYINYTWVH